MKRMILLCLAMALAAAFSAGLSVAVFAENAAKPNGQFNFEENVDNLTASDEDRSFYFTFDFDDAPTAFMTFNLTVTGEASVSANQSANEGVVSLVTTAKKNNYKDVTWDRDAVRGAYANANNIEATEIDGFDFHLPANASGEFEITLTVTQWGYYTNDDVATDNSKTYYVNINDEPLMYSTTVTVKNDESPLPVKFEKIEGFNGSFPEDTEISYGATCTFKVPEVPKYTVKPLVTIGGEEPYIPQVINGEVTVENLTGDLVVQFLLTPGECAGNADNGYLPEHRLASDIVYTWYGFRTCEASRTCDCGEIMETMTATVSAEVVEAGAKRRYTAVFDKEEALFETEPQFKYGAPMTVSFRLVGDYWHGSESLTAPVGPHTKYVTWIPTTTYLLYEGMTAADVMNMALEQFSLKAKESGNYIAGIKAPEVLGGYWLEEFSNGDNSGWLYVVNGTSPGVGLSQYELVLPQTQLNTVGEGVDAAIFMHYVDDYTKEDVEREAAKNTEDISPDEFLWKSCALEKVADRSYVLKMAAVPKNAYAIAAGYTTEGQMIGSVVLDLENMTVNAAGMQQMSVTLDGTQVKIFFLNTTTQHPMRTYLPFFQ